MPGVSLMRRLPSGTGFAREGRPVVVTPSDETHEIHTVEQWRVLAGPLRGDLQWKEGRRAMEVARAWCGEDEGIRIPAELDALLGSNETAGRMEIATVIPELRTPLGDVRRGARRHDLILLGV